jgi:flagellar operon protein
MTDRLTIGQIYPGSIRASNMKTHHVHSNTQDEPFQNVLQNELVRFSNHAEQRLKQRGIEFKPEQLAKIQTAIDKAASKGAKDSLMLINDTALIVNIKNRTVVTALDEAAMKDNLFTQIDSAVIIS